MITTAISCQFLILGVWFSAIFPSNGNNLLIVKSLIRISVTEQVWFWLSWYDWLIADMDTILRTPYVVFEATQITPCSMHLDHPKDMLQVWLWTPQPNTKQSKRLTYTFTRKECLISKDLIFIVFSISLHIYAQMTWLAFKSITSLYMQLDFKSFSCTHKCSNNPIGKKAYRNYIVMLQLQQI